MEFELSFGGREADLPAVSVEREDISLRLVGKVDRVDGWVKDGKLYLRVVDYKTGRKSLQPVRCAVRSGYPNAAVPVCAGAGGGEALRDAGGAVGGCCICPPGT